MGNLRGSADGARGLLEKIPTPYAILAGHLYGVSCCASNSILTRVPGTRNFSTEYRRGPLKSGPRRGPRLRSSVGPPYKAR